MLSNLGKNKSILALARWLRRRGPIVSLALALATITLFFVGCLSFSESMGWRPLRPEEAPPETIVERQIRVRLLDRKARSTVQLAITSPFKITETKSGRELAGPQEKMSRGEVRAIPGTGIQMGARTLACSDILIHPARDASIVLEDKTYRGLLRIQRTNEGLVFTNHVDIEAYLRGVLRGELPRSFHPEAFRAQAVAARTYALYMRGQTPATRSFDVTDDESSQVYEGVQAEESGAVAAVEATSGEVCLWGSGGTEAMFCTYYSSSCGGMSQHVNNVKPRDPDVPPLAGGVACDDCRSARHYRWGPVTISKVEATKRLLARYPSFSKLGMLTAVRAKELTKDGRIIRLEVIGSGGQKETLMGEDFRLSMGGRIVKSTRCTIVSQGGNLIFKDGRGFGHGMGLCQYGMETKARRGIDHRQILATYYPGAVIKKIY